MKPFYILVPCLLWGFFSFGQAVNKVKKIEQAAPNLFYVTFDSSTCKSVLVEFDNYLALIETPASDLGGGAKLLKDHKTQGENAYKLIKHKFPRKPIKYIFCSHWHPHSVSSVSTFIEHGAVLVLTKGTLTKLETFQDFKQIKGWEKHLQVLDKDSLVLEDKTNKLIAYRLLKKDYPNIPTDDYVHFYLPKLDAMHVGCMYNKQVEYIPGGKEFVTGREKDLYAFIAKQSWKPKNLIRLAGDTNYKNGMLAYAGLQDVIMNGIELRDIALPYFQLSAKTLQLKQDSLLQEILMGQVPRYIFNQAAYQSLQKKQLDQALGFAKLQAMLLPTDPNSWDTLGEVYYFLGQKEIAVSYETIRKKIDPKSEGGLIAWESDLKEYQGIWAANQIP